MNVIKSFEAATRALASIRACNAVSSLVKAVTLVASLDCSAVSSVLREATLSCTTLILAFNSVKVIKSFAPDVAFFKLSIVIFLVVSPPTSTIGTTSLSATSTAASSVSSVIFTFAIFLSP